VHVKQTAGRWGGGGKEAAREQQLNFLVVENLFYGHDIAVKYDLKGSQRSRYTAPLSTAAKTTAQLEEETVLLDENLLETMPAAPILVDEPDKYRMQVSHTFVFCVYDEQRS